MKKYLRAQLFQDLWQALRGKVSFIQAVVGPRQVGKTTLALQIFERWPGLKRYETADQPGTPTIDWLRSAWTEIRKIATRKKTVLLILDEIQKIPSWSETVKKMYDEDKRFGYDIRVLMLGSSSLLMQRGLSESLAGRFELHRHYQWSYQECQEAFGLKLDDFLYFGGYPGALALRGNDRRWASYIRDSLIETVLAKDVLLLSPVTKPALLRQIFHLAAAYPAQIISYQKILGNLQDAGNTTTIAAYLRLLANAFLVLPLERYSGATIKQRGSTPKLITLDNAIISALCGRSPGTLKNDRPFWGRLVENSVGATLYKTVEKQGGQIFYWRLRQDEVDFVVQLGQRLLGIEVKSGPGDQSVGTLKRFIKKYPQASGLIIANAPEDETNGIRSTNVEKFLTNPENYLA